VTSASGFGYHSGAARSDAALKPCLPILALLVAGLSGCGPNYSPDTYNTNAVQQANKVEQGIIVGVRQVGVTASGTTGTVSGAAAGGIAGAQAGTGPISALTALGGSLVGGLAGAAVEHATADTAAFEYIVRKANNDLVSVTQKDKTPLALGLHVLVIAGNQARVVPDYTVAADLQPKPSTPAAPEKPKQPGAAEADKPVAADADKPSATDAATPASPAAASTASSVPAVVPSSPGTPVVAPSAAVPVNSATTPRSASPTVPETKSGS
jgi:outer membrane lipoprotein SlyB